MAACQHPRRRRAGLATMRRRDVSTRREASSFRWTIGLAPSNQRREALHPEGFGSLPVGPSGQNCPAREDRDACEPRSCRLGLLADHSVRRLPYLVTRIVPTMYHVIVAPDDLDPARLIQIARRPARYNALPTCLVRAADAALYVAIDGRESRGEPPRGGVIVTDRLRLCQTFHVTQSLVARRLALGCFTKHTTPKTGYMFGDRAKGGRTATVEETGRG